MKKFFFLAVAACALLAGCAKVEKNPSPSHEIDFQAAKYLTSTKADDAGTNDDGSDAGTTTTNQAIYETTNSFGTFSFSSDEAKNINGGEYKDFMRNEEITYHIGYGWKANRDVPYFWPETGTLDFVSYSPYYPTPAEGATDSKIPTVGTDQTTLTWTGYTVNYGHADDLMYADKAVGLKENKSQLAGSNTGVPTLFHHALAQVKFQFNITTEANAKYSVYLKELRLENIYNSGDLELAINSNDDATTDFMQGWTLPVNNNGYNVWTDLEKEDTPYLNVKTDNGFEVTTTRTCYTDGTNSTDFFYVLPQELVANNDEGSEGQKMYIKFDLKVKTTTTDGAEGEQLVDTYDWTTYLNTRNLQSWEINKLITYTVTFDPPFNEITFDPAVVAWSSADQTITFD
jgi:hypothetical protein